MSHRAPHLTHEVHAKRTRIDAREALAAMSGQRGAPFDEDLGVDCPACGVRLDMGNVGGYRTYCEKCADAAALANSQS